MLNQSLQSARLVVGVTRPRFQSVRCDKDQSNRSQCNLLMLCTHALAPMQRAGHADVQPESGTIERFKVPRLNVRSIKATCAQTQGHYTAAFCCDPLPGIVVEDCTDAQDCFCNMSSSCEIAPSLEFFSKSSSALK